MITYRKAKPEDVHSALDLALRVFMEYEAPLYEPQAVESLQADITLKKSKAHIYTIGNRPLFVAMDGEYVVGMIDARESGHIQSMYVDGAYHRKGIATVLMSHMVCELKLRGFNRITVDSSPNGLPFYKHFGFVPTDNEQKRDGFILTPMAYEPNEIWDVYDINRNKTGRYAERGRKMAAGDYHLVVHVWKHNGKGEWLIDKRAPARGTSIDGKWETTGGSALAGDDSLTAALRETKEELGIDLDPQKGVLFHTTTRHGNDGHTWLQDAWVFEHNCPIEDVRFQEGETCDAMWASPDKIREMMAAGEFLSEWFYPYFEEMVEKWKVKL
jgi:8-oxo-dGTP pyrophosphatase MutT (NUDIX family)/GNAT superfamily N-acetyltransferase